MSFPVFNKNKNIDDISYDPNLFDLLMKFKKEIMRQINCVKVGKINSYDSFDNIAEVQILSKLKLINGDVIEYPVLKDCPVFYMSGGSTYISTPIESGDECLVLFSDRSIDNWHTTSNSSLPQDSRMHSISDGIVLVGINSLPNKKTRPMASLCINGGSSKISIKNDSFDLKTELDTLFDKINSLIDVITDMNTQIALITVSSFGAPPNNASYFTSFNTTLGTYKADITQIKDNIDDLLDEGSI